MTNDREPLSAPAGPERFEPVPTVTSNADATQEVPVTSQTHELPPVPGEPTPPPTAPVASATAPAANPPRWSGKKTAVAAALAIGLSGAGAVAAAAALPSGQSSNLGDRTGVGPGGGQGGQGLPGGQRGQGGPGGPGGFGGQQPDPNQQGGQQLDPNQQGGQQLDPNQQGTTGSTGSDPSQVQGRTT